VIGLPMRVGDVVAVFSDMARAHVPAAPGLIPALRMKESHRAVIIGHELQNATELKT
jgi:hypothetical protein